MIHLIIFIINLDHYVLLSYFNIYKYNYFTCNSNIWDVKIYGYIDFDDFNKCYAPVMGVGIGLAVSAIIDLFDENKSFIDHIKSTVFRLFQSSFTPAFS